MIPMYKYECFKMYVLLILYVRYISIITLLLIINNYVIIVTKNSFFDDPQNTKENVHFYKCLYIQKTPSRNMSHQKLLKH